MSPFLCSFVSVPNFCVIYLLGKFKYLKPQSDTELFHCHKELSHIIPLYLHTLFPNLEQLLTCFSFLYFCHVSNAINRIKQVLLLDWCLIFSKYSAFGIHSICCIYQYSVLFILSSIWLYECSSLFIHSPTDGHLGAFNILLLQIKLLSLCRYVYKHKFSFI